MGLVLSALLFILLGYVISTIIRKKNSIIQFFRVYNAMKSFPCPTRYWLLGNLPLLDRPHEGFIKQMLDDAREFESCHVYWYGIFPVLICSHSEAAKAIIKASVPKGDWVMDWVKPWLGHGLPFESGMRWARNRKLLTPAFHFDMLKSYNKVYNECANVLIDNWNSYAENRESFDGYEQITLLSFDIILQCAFSVKTKCQTIGKDHPYIKAVRELSHSFADRILYLPFYIDLIYRLSPTGRRFHQLCDYVHNYGESVIKNRQKMLDENGNSVQQNKKHLDFLDILLQARDEDDHGLTLLEIREEVDSFMFAGHDTTSSALSWTLYCLAKYPEHQHKVREEVDKILCNGDDMEWNDLSRLPYATMCIKEAMRLYTTVPVVERKMDQDMEIDGKLVPAGTPVHLKIFLLCHREEVWPNPSRYDPERFSFENVKSRDPYTYIPFSAGKRNCIGQNFAMAEIKVVLAKIIYNYELEIDETHKVRQYFSLINQPEYGLWIRIKRRHY